MVDTAMQDEARQRLRGPRLSSAAGDACVTVAISADAQAYPVESRDAVWAPAQSPQWVRAWAKEAAADAVIASLRDTGGVVLSLPLEVVGKGPFRVARFMGGSHANGNFPYLIDPTRVDMETLNRLVDGLKAARPDIDLLLLERLAPEIGGLPNPLTRLSHSRSPNIALAVSLEGGFDGLLSRGSPRRSKRYRSQLRKFEAVGGLRRIVAADNAEVDRLLDAFFEMKSARFRTMGVKDAFSGADIRAFFRRLFKESLAEPKPSFTLSGLDVGGKLRAVTGHSHCGDRMICEFAGMADDELAAHSPGHFLFYENIRAAADAGYRIYDFSVGDEPYKRAWCDIEEAQFDIVLPMSARGRLLATLLRTGAQAKGFIKRNPALWRIFKQARQALRGRSRD